MVTEPAIGDLLDGVGNRQPEIENRTESVMKLGIGTGTRWLQSQQPETDRTEPATDNRTTTEWKPDADRTDWMATIEMDG